MAALRARTWPHAPPYKPQHLLISPELLSHISGPKLFAPRTPTSHTFDIDCDQLDDFSQPSLTPPIPAKPCGTFVPRYSLCGNEQGYIALRKKGIHRSNSTNVYVTAPTLLFSAYYRISLPPSSAPRHTSPSLCRLLRYYIPPPPSPQTPPASFTRHTAISSSCNYPPISHMCTKGTVSSYRYPYPTHRR